MNREIVFVGGVADGRRIVLDGTPPVVEFPVMEPLRVTSFDDPELLVESIFRKESYTRRALNTGPTCLVFYAAECLDDTAAFSKLFDGYKGTANAP